MRIRLILINSSLHLLLIGVSPIARLSRSPEGKSQETVKNCKSKADASSEGKVLTPEEMEKKKKKEEKAREKELKNLKVAQKAEVAKQAQANSSVSKTAKKKSSKRDGGEEKLEDCVDPETPLGEKKKLSLEMAKTFNPSVAEKSWYAWWTSPIFLLQTQTTLNHLL